MGKINMGKVIVGGLVAGLVLNVADFLVQGVYLKPDWDAVMASLPGHPTMAGSTIALFVVLDFVIGLFGLFGYACIRPRFGPGPRTAVIAGLMVWFACGVIAIVSFWPMHILTDKLIAVSLVEGLIVMPVAIAAGAKLYSEEGAAA
jgi:hypothetical protein